ncbi:MAG: bifunctional (p)ppGpp synthetase/guanosine-3',5'-bis(diphosphate) 3'-pyrophosphohydrolase [Eubacteriales bacterium]|nr:bifunctional (p)ppGpp synthetase/guanosine-3',5'-bis(diphosphate) 3'-pyrophosphohydrolase [Eubacteriales bacterium]
MSLEQIYHNIAKYAPDFDRGLIERAWKMAESAHSGQVRESGEAYIMHPLAVAVILTELEQDLETVAAGILHDVVEDTEITLEDIEAEFGPEIALLVDGVTKLMRLRFQSKAQQQAENLRKMFMAMASDFRVILIKFADRLHNMRTLDYLPAARQKDMARETLEIYAPLAHRLGIFRFKWELEDLAFRYLHPREYYSLVAELRQRRTEREEIMQRIIDYLEASLTEAGIKADITGRPKHLYSIWQKMTQQQKELSEIYDLTAIRVVVSTVRDCYTVLGQIHHLCKPIPGHFKDYIAMPKSNGYQSLHTTVVALKGNPVEVQIRTWDMHRVAEYGLAAHWRYKEGGKGDRQFDEKLAWLRQFMEWQKETKDTNEFIETLKVDLFDDEVLVFTPKGDVIDLPIGAVPLDFAYRIHTDIGHRTVGAKVNGKLVPLNHQLETGDIVEILTQKGATPSRDWLKTVKSSQARTKIRQWFKREGREQNIEKGRELLLRELKRFGLALADLDAETFASLLKRYNYQADQEEDFFAALGYGGLNAVSVGRRIYEYVVTLREKELTLADVEVVKGEASKSEAGIMVKGVDNLLVHFARCCKPLPGDEIVGYVTRGRGISVHREDCPNIREAAPERLLEVQWGSSENQIFPVELVITAWDRKGLLQEIMNVLGELKANILSINGSGLKDGSAQVHLTVEVHSLEHLGKISDKLKSLKSVMEVSRQTRT